MKIRIYTNLQWRYLLSNELLLRTNTTLHAHAYCLYAYSQRGIAMSDGDTSWFKKSLIQPCPTLSSEWQVTPLAIQLLSQFLLKKRMWLALPVGGELHLSTISIIMTLSTDKPLRRACYLHEGTFTCQVNQLPAFYCFQDEEDIYVYDDATRLAKLSAENKGAESEELYDDLPNFTKQPSEGEDIYECYAGDIVDVDTWEVKPSKLV